MEPKLYWWILYADTSMITDKLKWLEVVIDVHPFTASKILNKQIINWKSISEKEYELWKELHK